MVRLMLHNKATCKYDNVCLYVSYIHTLCTLATFGSHAKLSTAITKSPLVIQVLRAEASFVLPDQG